MTAETITREPWETDNAPAAHVLVGVLRCALAWVPEARIIGNVRAGDIARAVTEALDEPARLSAARAEGVREGIEMARSYIHDTWDADKLGPPGIYASDCLADAYTSGAIDAAASIEVCLRALSPAPAEAPTTPTVEESDGWIEWRGGECPVEDGIETHAKMRDGVTGRSLAPRGWCGWQHDPRAPGLDIIAYRIVQPAEASAPVAEGDLDDETAALMAMDERIRTLEAEVAALREGLRRLGNAAMAMHDHPDHPEAKPFVRAEYDRVSALLQGQGGADDSGAPDGR